MNTNTTQINDNIITIQKLSLLTGTIYTNVEVSEHQWHYFLSHNTAQKFLPITVKIFKPKQSIDTTIYVRYDAIIEYQIG